jgi:hypothetical protein
MHIANQTFSEVLSGRIMRRWSEESRGVMQKLLHAPYRPADRRMLPRNRYHLQTELMTTGNFERTVPIYTRDINAWNVGFICAAPLMPGTRAVVQLMAPDGRRTTVGCRVRRCQEFQSGWFEAFAEFCLPQYSFDNLCYDEEFKGEFKN